MTRLACWWQRNIRRHFCFRCDRTTFHMHSHDTHELSAAALDLEGWWLR